jgi:uncharacterized protein YndB with AHSA1/START domain
MTDLIQVQTTIAASRELVWECYTAPEHVTQWNHASPDWHSPQAENDLRVGGRFNYRMEARDGSVGFDFTGVYEEVVPLERISYVMDDGRKVVTTFEETEGGGVVTTLFDPEHENTRELQQSGWQAILNNFKLHAEQH